MPTTDPAKGGAGRGRILDVLRNVAGIALAVAFAFFLFDTVRTQIDRIGASALWPGRIEVLSTVVLLFAWALNFLLASESCLRRLLGVTAAVTRARSAAAFYQSFLLRYIPGKIWTAVGRAEALVPAVPRATALRCVLYEQLHLNVATAAVAVLLAGLMTAEYGAATRLPLILAIPAVAVGVLIWLFFPAWIFELINRMTRWAHRMDEDILVLEGSAGQWRLTFIIFVSVLVLQGLSMGPLIYAFAPDPGAFSPLDWFALLAAYPVARMVGQLAVVVPGGIGVREGAYVLLLLPVADPSVTTSAAAWMRLLSLIPETVLYLFFAMAARRSA